MNDVIVVGVDGSSAGDAAIRWAAERAESRGYAIELIHVVDDEWGMVGENQLDELHPEAVELVDSAVALARSVAPRVVSTGTVRVGDPMVELAELSRAAVMVVIGTHKTGFFHGRALGSRSLQLAAMAWCPVAVIPEFSSTARKNIVVGVDDSAAGDAAVRFGARESTSAEEPLVIVHAREEASRTRTPSSTAVMDTVTQGAVGVAKVLGAPLVRAREIRRPAAEALIDASLQARLLVIGTSRRRGSELSALGPVGHDVLMNITGPTVVVHGDMTQKTEGAIK